jgi:hypothetical protein
MSVRTSRAAFPAGKLGGKAEGKTHKVYPCSTSHVDERFRRVFSRQRDDGLEAEGSQERDLRKSARVKSSETRRNPTRLRSRWTGAAIHPRFDDGEP